MRRLALASQIIKKTKNCPNAVLIFNPHCWSTPACHSLPRAGSEWSLRHPVDRVRSFQGEEWRLQRAFTFTYRAYNINAEMQFVLDIVQDISIAFSAWLWREMFLNLWQQGHNANL